VASPEAALDLLEMSPAQGQRLRHSLVPAPFQASLAVGEDADLEQPPVQLDAADPHGRRG
tara:strand:+ start:445 stop:624 length:180 start_codon:yes stop_codon:yes gene_type:complete